MNFRQLRRPGVIIAALFVLFVVFIVGCDGPRGDTLPAPSSTSPTEPQPTTSTVDYRQVPLETVAGNTTVPPAISKGTSVIFGAVDAGEGLLVDATVRIEHLVGDQVQSTDVRTGEDGRFRVEGIAGGRYRVRGFHPPTHTMAEPEVFFLRNGDEREVHLRVEPVSGLAVRSSTMPAAPFVGQGVNLAVRVARRTVDDNGIAREEPIVGVPVSIRSSGWLAVELGAVKLTDGDGVVVFTFSCENVSNVTATAVIGEQSSPTTEAEDDDGTTTTDTVQPDGQEPAGQQPQPAEPTLESLGVPPCAPRPTTTTTTTTTTTSTTEPPAGDNAAGNGDDDN